MVNFINKTNRLLSEFDLMLLYQRDKIKKLIQAFVVCGLVGILFVGCGEKHAEEQSTIEQKDSKESAEEQSTIEQKDSKESAEEQSTIEQKARAQLEEEKYGIKDVHFRFDQYGLEEVARVMLRKNAKILKEYPDLKIEIQGHCDERGSNNYNIALGERRALSIKMYLMSQGINASRIHTTSYGEEKPFCFEHTEECWFLNRRGHFMIGS